MCEFLFKNTVEKYCTYLLGAHRLSQYLKTTPGADGTLSGPEFDSFSDCF